MLQRVDIEPQPLEPYAEVIGAERVEGLRDLAGELQGLRLAHVSATQFGGGVAELLRSVVALERALGLDAEWRLIRGEDDFFEVTKALHNALQGGDRPITEEERETYLRTARESADLMSNDYDVVMVHDPQPLALRHFRGKDEARWIWRLHIDTSSPNRDALDFVSPFVEEHDALVFTMPDFIPSEWAGQPSRIIPPAIDPLSPKNMDLPDAISDRIIRWLGVDPGRPILTQVSRFDPWKDPLGVIDVFQEVRGEVDGLQLALLGSMALDDPQGWQMYEEVRERAGGDVDIHVATNVTGVSSIEVNAFQRRSDVVLQKSIREGFGLVVSETLWKKTPVVAGRAGGIPLQMPDGAGGALVEDPQDYPREVLRLLTDRDAAAEAAERGHRHVRERFLVDRLVADELRLVADVRAGRPLD